MLKRTHWLKVTVCCMKSNWLTIKDVHRHGIFMCCIYEAAVIARIQLIYFGYQQRRVCAFLQDFCLNAVSATHKKKKRHKI